MSRRASFFVGFAMLCVTGCRSDAKEGGAAPNAEFTLEIKPSPPAVGEMHTVVGIRGANGEPLAGAQVELEATMTHPGMVPVFAKASEARPGYYEADVRLTMKGDWILLVDATWPNGLHFEHRFEISGVGMSGSTGGNE